MFRRRAFFAVGFFALALIAVTVGSAKAATAKRIDLGHLSLGTATVRDHPVNTFRRLASVARSSWWGGTYYTHAGEPVRINVSDTYRYDPGFAQSVAYFLGDLTHGSELPRVTIWVGDLTLTQMVCGQGALGCYDPNVAFLNVIGNDVPGYTVEQVLMHEYGHHVANNRVNPPWQSAVYGPKRWASYENVCARTAAGQAFPGDEGAHYLQNPGEAFAESYMFLNAQRFGLLLPPWDFDPMFMPDYGALSKITQDVTSPWNGDTNFAWSGKLGGRGATRSAGLPTALDGSMSFRVSAPRGSLLRVYSNGQLLGTVRGSAYGTICGQRSLTTRLVGGGAGRFRVVAQIP